MGKKNNTITTGLPIDQYRKQMGKQEQKKSRQDLKEAKRINEAKKNAMSIQDVALMLGAFLVLLLSVYLFFYMYLVRGIDHEDEKS